MALTRSDDPLEAPTLYLFSDDDELCDAQKVSELVAARRQRGTCAEVRVMRWGVSQHVGHVRKHPEEYTAALLGFLKGCV